ncbi:MAG: class I SAM-dependent methyltransferase [Clostridia bacterium]|nr:class I SAM-dependent methyltransferase [Clostridia bacterium]
MWKADQWREYELLDTSDGERLERWGKYILVRPDPQIIWKDARRDSRWKRPDAAYRRSSGGGGAWRENKLPESWELPYESLGLHFVIKPMGFKHTGLFPEQAVNWEWFSRLIAEEAAHRDAEHPVKVLNLFGYTGGATVAAAKAGAAVCHVDAAKGMVQQCKDNARLCGLADAPIRYIVDDCKKFVEREIRRGNRYDAVIMDPPSYGRGPSGEVWKLEENIDGLLSLTTQVLSDNPLFFLVNSYTTGLSPSAMGYLLHLYMTPKYGGVVTSDEIGIPVTASGAVLPCGSSSRWSRK